jgi:hypothetical protein
MGKAKTPSVIPEPAAHIEPGGTRRLYWLQGLLCGGVAVLATPTALLVAMLLAPGLLALLFDRQPGQATARSMLLFGAAALASPLRRLWESGHSLSGALTLLSDPIVLGTAWLAAGFGWLLNEMMPILMQFALEARSKARVRALHAARARLTEEWGLESETAGDASAPPAEGRVQAGSGQAAA